MTDESPSSESREERIDELIAQYLLAKDAGKAPRMEDWLAQHAEFSTELKDFLICSSQLERMSESLDASTGAVPKSRPSQRPAASVCEPTRAVDHVSSSEASSSPWPAVVQAAVPGRFTPGTVILERYHLISQIGKGGMGEVYRAYDVVLSDFVALKFLSSQVDLAPEVLEPFLSEVRLARQIHHENVCSVFDIGDFDGEPFISMEFVDGENLASLLHRVGRLPVEKALSVAEQLCCGLNAAHERGVLHRDLKPSNIMLDREGYVRIMDFGLAILEKEADKQSEIAGTPKYMAPEQWSDGDVSARTDIYALGLTLYQIFTGEPAYAGEIKQGDNRKPEPPSVHCPGMHPTIEAAILKCLEKKPENRPQSASLVMLEFPPKSESVWREPLPVDEERPEKRAARRWKLVAMGLVGVLLASLAANVCLWQRSLPIPLTANIATFLAGSQEANHKIAGQWCAFWYKYTEPDDVHSTRGSPLAPYGLPEPVIITTGGDLLVGRAYNTMRVKDFKEQDSLQLKNDLLETEYYWILRASGGGRFAALYFSPPGDRERLVGSFFLTKYIEGKPGDQFSYFLGEWHGHCDTTVSGEPVQEDTHGKVMLVELQHVRSVFDIPKVQAKGLSLTWDKDDPVWERTRTACRCLFD